MYITNSINDMNEDYNSSITANSINNSNQLDLKAIAKNKAISMCVGCGTQINDQYILRVSPDLEWHAKCLKCFECGIYLDENCTCFVRNGKTYCKLDYVSKKCFKCKNGFNKNDLVMRASNRIYHIDCFRCCMCNRQLSPGDEFALKDDGLLCKYDNEIFERQSANQHLQQLNPPTSNNILPLNTNINLANSNSTVGNNNITNSCQNITNNYTTLQNTTNTNNNKLMKCDDLNVNSNNNSNTQIMNDYEDNQNCLDTPNYTSLNSQVTINGTNQRMPPQPNNTNGLIPTQMNGSNGIINANTPNSKNGTTSASSSSSGSSSGSSSRANLLHGSGSGGHHRKDKTTRVRTVLNEKQLHTLRSCYGANPRPDALMKEQLVEMTGLSPRVIRVWFQNKRCKDKKKTILIKQMQEQQKNRQSIGHGIPMVATSPVRNDINNLGPGSQVEMQPSATAYQSNSMSWKSINEFGLNDMNNSIGHSIGSPNSRQMSGQSGLGYDQMMGFGSDEEDCLDQFSDNGGDDSVSSVGFDETRIQQL